MADTTTSDSTLASLPVVTSAPPAPAGLDVVNANGDAHQAKGGCVPGVVCEEALASCGTSMIQYGEYVVPSRSPSRCSLALPSSLISPRKCVPFCLRARGLSGTQLLGYVHAALAHAASVHRAPRHRGCGRDDGSQEESEPDGALHAHAGLLVSKLVTGWAIGGEERWKFPFGCPILSCLLILAVSFCSSFGLIRVLASSLSLITITQFDAFPISSSNTKSADFSVTVSNAPESTRLLFTA